MFRDGIEKGGELSFDWLNENGDVDDDDDGMVGRVGERMSGCTLAFDELLLLFTLLLLLLLLLLLRLDMKEEVDNVDDDDVDDVDEDDDDVDE